MTGSTHVSTWVDAEMKRRFGAIAEHEGLSESALLKRMIALMIESTHLPSTGHMESRATRDARVTVRIRADDQQLLMERAATRGMPAATYVSVLVRAHLRSLAPLPKDELLALRRTLSELGAVGRNLNQIAKAANQLHRTTGLQQDDLRAILRLCSGLRDHVKSLLMANLRSWEVGYATEDDRSGKA